MYSMLLRNGRLPKWSVSLKIPEKSPNSSADKIWGACKLEGQTLKKSRTLLFPDRKRPCMTARDVTGFTRFSLPGNQAIYPHFPKESFKAIFRNSLTRLKIASEVKKKLKRLL